MRLMNRMAALLMLLALLAAPFARAEEAPLLEVHQMMIGCADGYLIRFGDVDIMIDGGNAIPKQPTTDVVDYLRAAGVTELDAHIITHWHLDHCMNLNHVLAEFGAEDTVVYSPSPALNKDYAPLAAGTHQQMKMGDVLTFTSGGAEMKLHCIGPEKLSQGGNGNPDSLNFVIVYGSRKFLFTGDFAASCMISGAYSELCANVDVLKFPHHAIEPFEIGNKAMRVVRPDWVMVPGVINKHKLWNFADNIGVKFPRDQVLTNGDGHVVIVTDGGERFEVHTQVQPESFVP